MIDNLAACVQLKDPHGPHRPSCCDQRASTELARTNVHVTEHTKGAVAWASTNPDTSGKSRGIDVEIHGDQWNIWKIQWNLLGLLGIFQNEVNENQ